MITSWLFFRVIVRCLCLNGVPLLPLLADHDCDGFVFNSFVGDDAVGARQGERTDE